MNAKADAEVLAEIKGGVIKDTGIDDGILTIDLVDGRQLCFANWRGYVALWIVAAEEEVLH